MYHDLIPLARGAGVHAMVQRGLGDQRERIGLLLLHRWRVGVGHLIAPPLVQALPRRLQRLQEQRPHLRGQPASNPHRTVFVFIHVQRPPPVVACGLVGLSVPVHPAPTTHDPLNVLRCARAAYRQHSHFGLGRRHAGQLPHLGVGQLAAGERLRQQRQRAERARDPDVLPGRTRRISDAPAQPVRARAEAVVPAAARVELPDQVEQTRGRRLEMCRELRDLVAQAIQRGVVDSVGRADFHGEVPFH